MPYFIDPINNHNLKNVNNMDIAMCFLADIAMNEFVGATIVN
jgi:hypothetical protein